MPKSTLAGLPVHPQMIGAPTSLLPFGLILDLVYLATKRDVYARAGFYSMLAGCISGAAAAVAGALDYFTIPRRTATKNTANVHATLNLCIVAVYGANLLVRRREPVRVSKLSLLLSVAGNLLLTLTAWYGSKLVYAHGMRVEGVSPVADEPELKLPGDQRIARRSNRIGGYRNGG